MSSDAERYQAAAHAMQSGVAVEMQRRPQPTEPKHLRVGINTAHRDHASLVGLLIEKGVISREEYTKAIADGMEAEAAEYEDRLGVSLA